MRFLRHVWIGLCFLVTGCASAPSYKAAGCDRFRMQGYNILACNDASVGLHCARVCRLTDSGKPVTYHPRACHIPGKNGRKATIAIGKSFLACLPHEIAHNEHPNDPAFVEKNYPCVGDRGTN